MKAKNLAIDFGNLPEYISEWKNLGRKYFYEPDSNQSPDEPILHQSGQKVSVMTIYVYAETGCRFAICLCVLCVQYVVRNREIF